MTSAGKIELLTELLNQGFLCKCPFKYEDDLDNLEIAHQDDCTGGQKLMEILNNDSLSNTN